MCTVSNISDAAIRYPTDQWTSSKWQNLVEALEAAKKFDAATDQSNCEDPTKIEALEKILDKLIQIEARLDRVEEFARLKLAIQPAQPLSNQTFDYPFIGGTVPVGTSYHSG